MKVVLLCGGKGTRIRDVRSDVPKPMVEIGGVPIVRHLMNYFARFGLTDFVLCLGYQGDVIREYFSKEAVRHPTVMDVRCDASFDGESQGQAWRVTLAETGRETMTAGRLRRARQFIGDGTFMVTYGDGLSNIDLHRLLHKHNSIGKILTVSGVRPPSRFGELTISEDLVVGFNEKPQTSSGLISGGFFVAETTIFDYLGTSDETMFEREPIEALVAAREVSVYVHTGFWQCMDTYRDWEYLNELAKEGDAPWMV